VADIFVSYTSKDRDWAFWIGQELENLGHIPRLHEWEISAGGDISRWMEERHHSADHVLCVVSAAYLSAPYSSWERRAAQWAATTGRPGFLIPVFVEPCEPPTLFAPLKRCDLHGLNEGDARSIFANFLKPASKPSRPILFPRAPPSAINDFAFPGKAVLESPDHTGRCLSLPRPPLLAAVPKYLGSHEFVGRESELQTLSDWCAEADPHPMLLLEAIGGSGKSILTWELTKKYAPSTRSDWAGLFWYSFYEKGAVMADFCCQALAYITQRPIGEFRRLGARTLGGHLVEELQQRPWLLVLDGLERILVAYHRHDAPQAIDSDAGSEVDQIANRDPCAAIRSEDGELLHQLTAVAPSKILVSSRLTPRILINSSQVVVPGVRREMLSGLHPADAEALLRRCGVTGSSKEIRAYLQHNCDCHPLVVGVLAGLINDFPHDRGNFDRWIRDYNGGMALKLSELSLVKRQNHILLAAIDALDSNSRRLLHLLSILQGAIDFQTLEALSQTQENSNPGERPKDDQALPLRRPISRDLNATILDLEKRGLLQYDTGEKRYDLHPVVRSVAAGRIEQQETDRLGQGIVDHFTRRQHDPWVNADTLEEVADGIQVVSTFLRMRRYSEGFYALQGDLANALYFNLGAFAELLALAEGFFADGWDREPSLNEPEERWYITNLAAASISPISEERARELYQRAIRLSLEKRMTNCLYVSIYGLANALAEAEMAASLRLRSLSLDLAKVSQDPELFFMSKLREYTSSVRESDWASADALWAEIETLGRDWTPGNYRPGDAEGERARDLLYRGKLTEEAISRAEEIAKRGGNRRMLMSLHEIRGEWYLSQQEPHRAAEQFSRALAMYKQNGFGSSYCEARIVLARVLAGDEFDAASQASEIETTSLRCSLAMAELWRALGEDGKATESAAMAYSLSRKWDGYVARYYLDAAAKILRSLEGELPTFSLQTLPQGPSFPWEAEVHSLIGSLRLNLPARDGT